MAFLFNKTNANYSTSQVHGVLRLETQNDQFVAVVNSFATMQAFEENKLNWQDCFPIPVSSAGNPQEWLISPDGPFAGGEILPPTEDAIEKARFVKLLELKTRRNQLEKTGFVYLDEVFDSNQDSYNRMVGVSEIAKNDPDFEIEWTLANNKTIHLSNSEILGMLPALANYAVALHATYNNLKEQVNSADDINSINNIIWPI